MATELQKIYVSEINVEIGWFWDGGIDVRLGDKMNGLRGRRERAVRSRHHPMATGGQKIGAPGEREVRRACNDPGRRVPGEAAPAVEAGGSELATGHDVMRPALQHRPIGLVRCAKSHGAGQLVQLPCNNPPVPRSINIGVARPRNPLKR
jgi:hypothetical protein